MAILKNLKQLIINKIEKEDRRQREEDTKNSIAWHSRAYHRHFEGTSEKYVTDPLTGKRKIERVYTGLYYKANISPQKYIAVKAWYTIAFLSTVIVFFYASLIDWQGYYVRLVTFSHALCFAANAYCTFAICTYITSGRHMTIPQYKDGPLRLKKATLLSAAAHFLACASVLVYALLVNDTSGITPAVCFALCSVLMLSIWLLESRLEYDALQNPAAAKNNGTQIQ